MQLWIEIMNLLYALADASFYLNDGKCAFSCAFSCAMFFKCAIVHIGSAKEGSCTLVRC